MAFACSMVSWVWLCAETARIWLRNCWSYSASEICVRPTSATTVSAPPRKMSATPHRAKASTRTPIMTEATQDLEAERSCWSMAKPNGLEGPRMIGRGQGRGKAFSKWEPSPKVSSKYANAVGRQLEDERAEGLSGGNPRAHAGPG